MKDYYGLLGLPPGAPAEDIKRAFRAQIARYHPDKVQHLGPEFQAMAADRAAELTEAYRILSDAGQRAAHDAARAASGAPAADAAATPPVESSPARTAAAAAAETAVPPVAAEAQPSAAERSGGGQQFRHERATRDRFVRKATVDRFRQAIAGSGEGYEEAAAAGFDLAFVPKSKLFARAKNPRLLGRFVSAVDETSVADAWAQAARWGTPNEEVCVFLMASEVAPPQQLAAAITAQRRKRAAGKVVLIPMDARNWDAHLPADAPAIARTLLARLRAGA
ncbi:MAG: J domain-containing protein [Acidobacteria bacterium]|nr:J domain-containing protein [Acidobacteriota bacterium]